MKHTQGKWEVRNPKIKSTSYIDNIIVGVDDSGTICGNVGTCMTEANANLIASAPEMLEALKKINNLELGGGFSSRLSALDDWARRVGEIVREVIAKAEGGSK